MLRAKLEGLISGVSEGAEIPQELLETNETSKPIIKTPKQQQSKSSGVEDSISIRRFTHLKLPFQEAKELVTRLRNEMSQTKIIEMLWDAKPGENNAYRQALAEYKELAGDEERKRD